MNSIQNSELVANAPRYPKDLEIGIMMSYNADFALNYLLGNAYILSKLHQLALKNYGVNIDPKSLARMLLSALWETDCNRLKAYRGECKIDSWLLKIFVQMMFPVLVNEGYVRSAKKTYRKPKLYISWEELPIPVRRDIIAFLSVGNQRLLMHRLHIECLPFEEVSVFYADFNEIQFQKFVTDTEETLANMLYNSNSEYKEFVVSSESPKVIFVEIEKVDFLVETSIDAVRYTFFYEDLESTFGRKDPHENFKFFIKWLGGKQSWSPRDIEITVERLIYDTPPVELAKKFNIKRAHVDNIFHIRKEAIIDYIRLKYNRVA